MRGLWETPGDDIRQPSDCPDEIVRKRLLIKREGWERRGFPPGPEVCTRSELRVRTGSDCDSGPIAPPALQESAPTSVRTATTRAPSPGRSSITCSATTGSRRAGQAPGLLQSRHPLPSGVQPSRREPNRLRSLRPGWRAQRAPGLPRAAPRRGPVGSPPAPGGPCATGEAVRPNPSTCPCGQGREARLGRGVPSTDASSVPSPLEPPSSWPCTCKCTTAAGLGAEGRPRPMHPRPMPEHRPERPLPVLRRKGRRAPGCCVQESLGWGDKKGREPSYGLLA